MQVIVAVMLSFTGVLFAEQAGYTITPIAETGVLYEYLGKANFFTKHWTILSKVEMPDLSGELRFANNCSSLVTQLCAEVNQSEIGNRCAVAVKEIESWVAKIEQRAEDLSHYTHAESSSRRKRSFFDGVGSVFKTFFGTMDHKDSENVYAALDELDNRENRTFTLFKEQTTVIKSTFDLFNASRVKAAAEREELWDKMSVIVAAQQSQNGEITSLQQRVEFNEILTLMTLHLREISDMQESYASILVSLSVGKLHPLIIHARELAEIMKNATRQLDLAEDFLDFQLLVQISKVTAIQDRQRILVRVDIPQPQRVAFDIHKVYTIPVAMDEEGYRIYDLEAEFIAANNHERQYVLLDGQQYGKCQQLTTLGDHPHFLCPQSGPIITAIGESCVLNLFRSFNVKAKACKEKVVQKWNTLVRMVTRNHWLFVMAGKTKLEVNCHNLPTAIGELTATGILTLEEHCHLQIGDLLIASEDDARRNVTLWQPVHSELPSWDTIKPRTAPKKTEATDDKKREVRLLAADNVNQAWRDQETDIQKMQNAVRNEEINRQRDHPHSIYLAATSVTGLISIASLIVVAGFAVHLRRWKKKQGRVHTNRLSILPTLQRTIKHPKIVQSEQPPGDKQADTNIEVIIPTTASLPTANLPTVVGKQLVQLE